MISLASADIPLKAYLNIYDCLKTERIGRGKYVQKLEEKAQEFFGVKHCIAVANGTLADLVMLSVLKELYPGKTEVVLPALTFVAQANAVLWAGLTPRFVDVGSDYQMDSKQARASLSEKTLCVFPVHLLGKEAHAATEINATIPIVEDCCEAMGGRYSARFSKRSYFGGRSLAGAFSMYPSHTITTGEGGLIITNSDQFAKIARSIHNHGKIDTDFDFAYLGINAKMTNLQAAIGCELVDTIKKVNETRRENVKLYNHFLGGNFYADAPHCYPYLLEDKTERDLMLKRLADNGIEARKLMGHVPSLKHFNCQIEYPNALRIANRGLFVPVHQRLNDQDIEKVCNVLLSR